MGTHLSPPQKGSGAATPIFGPCPLWPNGWMDPDGTWHGGGLGPDHIVLDEYPALLPPPKKRGGGASQFSAHVYCGHWPNVWMDRDATWYAGRHRPKRHCVTWGPSCPPPNGHNPQFSAHVYCGQTAESVRIPLGSWYGCRPQPMRHCVRWGTIFPSLKGHTPQFSANVRRGQTTGWTKMPLGMQ